MNAPDKWTIEIARTFVSVIKRNRFKAKILTEEIIEHPWKGQIYLITFEHSHQIFYLEFAKGRGHVHVAGFTKPASKFKFNVNLPRSNPPGIRRIALTYMKKVSNKPVFDTMNT